jgi:hypothetical protein
VDRNRPNSWWNQFQNSVDTFSPVQVEERSTLGTKGIQYHGKKRNRVVAARALEPKRSSFINEKEIRFPSFL